MTLLPRQKANPWVVVTVLCLFGFFILGSVLFAGSIHPNFTALLEKDADGWACQITVFNADPSRRLSVGLTRATLNGVPSHDSETVVHLAARETQQNTTLHFPASAAEPGKVSRLVVWRGIGTFGYHSSQQEAMDVIEGRLSSRFPAPTTNLTVEPLRLFKGRLGWHVRFKFVNNKSSFATVSVEKCWLNGQAPLLTPNSWELAPGTAIVRDVIFAEKAARSDASGAFHGYYQYAWGEQYRLSPISGYLKPEAAPPD